MLLLAMMMLFAVLFGTNFYLSRRIYQGISLLFPKLPFLAVFALLMLMTVLMVLGFVRSMLPASAGIKHALGAVSAYWMGVFVYLLLFTVLADATRLILRLCRCSFVHASAYRGISLAAVLLLTASTVIYGICHARQIRHVSYEVSLADKADVSDLHIVMISDLHLGALGSERRLASIVEEINALSPDLVCIAGDFFDTDFSEIRDPEKAIETIKGIASTYGVYACFGNHDAGKTFAQMQTFMESCGIRVLHDEYVIIDKRLVLIGRMDPSPIGGYGERGRAELSSFFVREDDSLPVIVLDHNPASIHTYSDEVDLILSGHTHKGQLFPANLLTGLLYTVDHGYYRQDESSPHVIVTSGVGYWGMPMRVGTDSEIVSIHIRQ